MQSLSLFLTRHSICYQSSDLSLPATVLSFEQTDSDPLDQLNLFLSELDFPKGMAVNLILDQNFIGLYYFNLPLVSRKKLDKLLLFELADNLLEDTENYYYDYRVAAAGEKESKTCVYTITKSHVDALIAVFKSHGLELKTILPLADLIDLKLRKKQSPLNDAFLIGDQFYTYLLQYKNGFLYNFSSLKTPYPAEGDRDRFNRELNAKIRFMQIEILEFGTLHLDEKINNMLSVDDTGYVSIADDTKANFLESIFIWLTESPLSSFTQKINLLKSNLFIFKELKKHKIRLLVTAVILGFCLLIFSSTLIYSIFNNQKIHQDLEDRFQTTINKYLPKSVSKENALSELQTRVEDLKRQQQNNEKYRIRSYAVSQHFSDVSNLKTRVNSLNLNRFFITDQSVRIQGEVSSYSDYNKLKSGIEKLYPSNQFALKFNQKSLGENLIQFTVIARPIKPNER